MGRYILDDFKNYQLGVHVEKMPENLFLYLKNNINRNEFVTHAPKLAGNIREEYNIMNLLTPELENYFLRLIDSPCMKYLDILREYQILTENRQFEIMNLWVNYMKKYEFNPVHFHDGLFSWVIIVNIPYDLETEMKRSPGINANLNTASCLTFYPLNQYGSLNTVHVELSKKDEGYILFFPAKYRHSVNPFYTSDDFRITISGNIHLNPNKK